MEDEPGVAVTVPPQSLLSSLGDAITRPSGKLSANAIPVSVTFVFGSLFGLLMVKLNKVVPFGVTLSGRKSLLIVGGKATPKVADAELPMPPLVELTAPVLLSYEPTTELVTFTLTVQKLLIAIVPPVRETLPDPTAAVAVPPQVLIRLSGLATTRFAGKLSVNATPLSGTVFAEGFVIVMFRVLIPLGAILIGLNAFVIVGGNRFTVTVVAAEGALLQPMLVTMTV